MPYRVRTGRAAMLLLAATIAGLCLLGPASRGAYAAPIAATFNPNLLLPNSDGAAEPSIRTDRFGQSFVIGPIGVPAGCKAFRVNHAGSAAAYLGFPDHTAGGGDCDFAIGPQETAPSVPAQTDDNLAYSSLTLANITVGKSSDGGNTFGPPNPGGAQEALDDRMWMAADPKLNAAGLDNVFMTYHDLHIDDIDMVVSSDGGQTYGQGQPIINPNDVPIDQWSSSCPAGGCVLGGPSLFTGNELGNVVAYRPNGTGPLTLFSIFETPDSAAANESGAPLNRLYEAVGTVNDTGATPVISWRNYEIWHGKTTDQYDRIFPITAVDSAGHVYAIWTDGNHIFTKSSTDGTFWGCPASSTPPGGPAPCTKPVQIANPAGVNTTIMPWAQAGRNGIVDVVYYGAHGGSGDQPTPQNDKNNQWNVYMAQTSDQGATWTVNKASDHTIHTGELCIGGDSCSGGRTLLDFFQVSIDPTNGAADIGYADDHTSPGSATVYFTRQCTGLSATTGQALVNDCKAPPPPPPPPPSGTTCPGPQVLGQPNTAPNNYPGGMGQNMDNMDVLNAFFGTPDANTLRVTMTIQDLEAPPTTQDPNLASALWTVYWDYNGTTYFAQAQSVGQGANAVYMFSDGTYANGNYNPVGGPTGVVTPGPNGTIVMDVPRADVGNPPNGATLTSPFADTHGSFVAVYYTAAANRAPGSGFGAPYVVGQDSPGHPCTPTSGGGTGGPGGTATATLTSDFNGTAIPGGDCVWFNTIMKPVGDLPAKKTTVSLESSTITFTAGGTTYHLNVPNAQVVIDPSAGSATTSYSSGSGWTTTVPISDEHAFLDGLMFGVPNSGLPGGIKPVSWTATFSADGPVQFNWQWAAAVYKGGACGADYNALGVKPIDSKSLDQYHNGDQAGTPENFKSSVTGGARGGGGSNYTGGYAGTAQIKLK